MQVGSVRPDGRPSNRTVVYRGLLQESGQNSDRLTFVTDSRSNKVAEFGACPWTEIAWYFPETREQYRFTGIVTVVDEKHTNETLQRSRLSAWKNMSDPGRQQFLWPHPGLPRIVDDINDSSDAQGHSFDAAPPSKDDPVANPFCLCIVDVTEVDHLNLKSNERRRWTLETNSQEWVEEYVNP